MNKPTQTTKNHTAEINKWLRFIGFEEYQLDRFKHAEIVYKPIDHKDYMVIKQGDSVFIFNLSLFRPVCKEESLSRWNKVCKDKGFHAEHLARNPYMSEKEWKAKRLAASILWYCQYTD